jgi:hypothetical protein
MQFALQDWQKKCGLILDGLSHPVIPEMSCSLSFDDDSDGLDSCIKFISELLSFAVSAVFSPIGVSKILSLP